MTDKTMWILPNFGASLAIDGGQSREPASPVFATEEEALAYVIRQRHLLKFGQASTVEAFDAS